MSRIGRRIVALLAIGGLLLALMPAAASAASPGQSERERILAFWTPSRMAAAVPRDFVRGPHGFEPAKKPGTGGGGNVTGASWTKEGLVLTATGKVYFEMDGGGWICSGSVLAETAADRSLVLTAGHCTYDEQHGAFATNWLFIPDFEAGPTYTCGSTAYGCWTADALVVDREYATAGGFNAQATAHDWGIAVVGDGGVSGTADLAATVGSFQIAYPGMSMGARVYAFGYPAAGRYNGSDLTYCAGSTFNDVYNANLTWGLSCNMTGGSSGGPWFSGFSEATGSGTISSLNSYGYRGIAAMYGPKFNAETEAAVAVARTATANTQVE